MVNIIRRWRTGWFGLVAMLASIALASIGASASEAPSGAAAGDVAVIRVDRTIETGLQRFLERALGEAEASGAETAVLVINTFGGRVDAATEIGEAIRSTPLRTIAYVEGKAISAGSYIALNADEIYMEETSTIGAAAVVDGSGNRVRDSKIVSVWVKQMVAAAERNGRNPAIAEGMVDDSAKVDMPEIGQVSEPGELITLTAQEAVAVGYAEGLATSFDEFLSTIGSTSQQTIEPTLAEQAARFLTHPATTTVLFILGIAGLVIELLVPGFGVPGIVGIVAFGLYFLGNYVAGFAGVEHLAMFVVGVLLLALELFIPSFGILGVMGIAALIAGVVLAAYDTGDALTSLGIATLFAAVIVAVFVRYFKHRGIWNKFILRDALKTEEGYVSHATRSDLTGKVGKAVTPLRPSGTAVFDDERVDVVTDGAFVAAGASVVVVLVDGGRIVVRETERLHLK
ncbi:NfeD family protein [Paenibacillus sp.]|uniref:NfeD family protein n=1 Tax=Paenibacillus sp. TaxID=58172 RepID=UPI0028120295|nr:NfeD family protein [Paenibacillus sp.]